MITDETQNRLHEARLVEIKQLAEATGFVWLKPSMVRHWICHSEDRYTARGEIIKGNNFDRCMLRIGRKILINVDDFLAWVLSHQCKG